jgi:nitroreductase
MAVEMRGGYPFRRLRRSCVDPAEAAWRAASFRARLEERRSVRMFAPEPVDRPILEDLLLAASSAPSGAHKQPWTFVAVSDPALKAEIREAAEVEERRNYEGRMPPSWLKALAPLGTDAQKPHLTDAAWLVVVFAQAYGIAPDGSRDQHYYVRESVGMACGLLVAAAHQAGLCALTHTPSPMAFLGRLLGRPENESAYVLVAIGWPAPDAVVPDLARKALDQVAVFCTGPEDRPTPRPAEPMTEMRRPGEVPEP